MLRNLVLGVAIVLTVLSAVMMRWIGPPAIAWVIVGSLLVVGTLLERVRYKRLADHAPDGRFERTTERFRDPTTGQVVDVYVDPKTGERAYVKD